MNSKSILLAFLCFVLPIAAQPVLRLHNGTEWTEIDAAAWAALPRSEITAKSRDGRELRYSGTPFAEILKLLSAPAGPTLRGKEMNHAVVLTATDGYRVVFSLVELDDSFRPQSILLADRAGGEALDDFEGKLMLVSADDLRHSRWIRQIESIALVRVVPPEP